MVAQILVLLAGGIGVAAALDLWAGEWGEAALPLPHAVRTRT